VDVQEINKKVIAQFRAEGRSRGWPSRGHNHREFMRRRRGGKPIVVDQDGLDVLADE
jgi:hypothetical protein